MVSEANNSEPGALLAIGDRVRMGALGRERHPKYGERQGLIVGQGAPSSWRVKFDGRRYVQAIHRDYLEKVLRFGPDSEHSIINDNRNTGPRCDRAT